MKCPNCGKEIANDSQFCEFCGTKIKAKKSKIVWWVIGIVVLLFIILVCIPSNSNESSNDEEMSVEENILESTPTTSNLLEDIRTQQAEIVAQQEELERQRQEIKRQQQSSGKSASQQTYTEQQARSEGYINLGLPSGTWWRKWNESGQKNYEQAVSLYKDNLPTYNQVSELFAECSFHIRFDALVVIGPNGDSIQFSSQGWSFQNKDYEVGKGGYYWTKTLDQPGKAFHYGFDLRTTSLFNNSDSCAWEHSIRLVHIVR